jgi:hypothetical protein
MGESYTKHVRDEEYIQNFGQKTLREYAFEKPKREQ